jgi:hypothetical protein
MAVIFLNDMTVKNDFVNRDFTISFPCSIDGSD